MSVFLSSVVSICPAVRQQIDMVPKGRRRLLRSKHAQLIVNVLIWTETLCSGVEILRGIFLACIDSSILVLD